MCDIHTILSGTYIEITGGYCLRKAYVKSDANYDKEARRANRNRRFQHSCCEGPLSRCIVWGDVVLNSNRTETVAVFQIHVTSNFNWRF